VAFTPTGVAGRSAVGFGSPSGDGDEGDLVSSGIAREGQTSGAVCVEKNVNFYQLESAKSTTPTRLRCHAVDIVEAVDVSSFGSIEIIDASAGWALDWEFSG